MINFDNVTNVKKTEHNLVVEISSDKVVGHLFIDSMSLVIQEVPPWLVPSGEIFQI